MTLRAVTAVLLIALGILAFAFTGINHATRDPSREFVLTHLTTARARYEAVLPPIAGGIAIAAGVLLLILDERQMTAEGFRG